MIDSFKTTHKYSLDSSGNLQKDGNIVPCHKLMPYATPSKLGGVEFNRFPCNLACGKAELHQNSEGQQKFLQRCEGCESVFDLEKQPEQKPDSKIISIIGQA